MVKAKIGTLIVLLAALEAVLKHFNAHLAFWVVGGIISLLLYIVCGFIYYAITEKYHKPKYRNDILLKDATIIWPIMLIGLTIYYVICLIWFGFEWIFFEPFQKLNSLISGKLKEKNND